jgi:ubiquinone/menaquinone biosynthesis C-methylase UbiE
MQTLTPDQAKAFYDGFGSKQDSQAFYEKAALGELIANGVFDRAHALFEFGCGTGALALELLQRHLPADATYQGVDISSTMTRLARERLVGFGDRATVATVSGDVAFALADASVDRVVSTYVLDLLDAAGVGRFLDEAARTLRADGLLCIAGITAGTTLASRIVMGIWQRLFAIKPAWVGGCRPSDLAQPLRAAGWDVRFHKVVVAWGVASDVIVAAPPRRSRR